MSSPTPQPAPSPTAPIYREKLWPSLASWVIVVGLSAASILIFIPISQTAGFVAFAVVLVLLTSALIINTPVIEVTADSLQVGRAHIEREFVGAVSYYVGDEAQAQRGPRLNGLAYLCIRGWIKPVVRIEITDPADRTPYWLASSRSPEHLVAALRGAGQSAATA